MFAWTALLLGAACVRAADEEEPDPAASEFLKQTALFAQKCLKCHTIGKGDRVGPDLKGATQRREREWLIGFVQSPGNYLDRDPIAKELLAKYNGVRMDELALTRPQVEGLLSYIETVSKGPAGAGEVEPEPAEEPIAGKLVYPDEGRSVLWVGLACAGLLLALTLALRLQGNLAGSGICLVLALGAGYWSLGGRAGHRLVGDQQGYAPVQPIAFSHQTHAGKLEIACLYCHHGAEKGPVAGVPSVNICMNCHRFVKTVAGTTEPSAEIKKLDQFWEARTGPSARSIPWVRVHNLPDFVFFNHQAHVQNNVQCQECHGPVQTMPVMRQSADLSMGWCLNCHRHEGRPAPSHWKRSKGTLDCAACHQ